MTTILRDSDVIRGSIRRNMITVTDEADHYGMVHFDDVRSVCPTHFNVIKDIDVVARQKAHRSPKSFTTSCRTCPNDFYNLAKGEVSVIEAGRKCSNSRSGICNFPQVMESNNHHCAPCPLGAICNGNIIPIDGHWGFLTRGELKFYQCPSGFCCSRQTVPCISYDTCATGRSGILCGSCSKGYSLSFVSDGCVLKKDVSCSLGVFVNYFIIASLVYTIIFCYLSHFIITVKEKIADRKQSTDEDDLIEMEDSDGVVIHVRASSDSTMELETDEKPLPVSAVITLVCFFLQVAALVHVDAHIESKVSVATDDGDAENAFLKSLFDFFNFRVTVYQRVCPTDDLTLPVKETINVALKLCSILNLFIFFIIWKFLSTLIALCSGRLTHDGSNEHCNENERNSPVISSQKPDRLSFASITKIGFIKLVKLNFTSISSYTLHMINCVSIGGQLHLYLYGDLVCYNWWQQIILFGVLPVVALFPLSFGISLNMLKERSISPTTFLFSSAIPYITFMLCAKKRMVGLSKYIASEEDERCIKEILQLEEELFRDDDSAIR